MKTYYLGILAIVAAAFFLVGSKNRFRQLNLIHHQKLQAHLRRNSKIVSINYKCIGSSSIHIYSTTCSSRDIIVAASPIIESDTNGNVLPIINAKNIKKDNHIDGL